MVLVLEMGVVLVEVMMGVMVWWFLRAMAADREIRTRATPRQKTRARVIHAVGSIADLLAQDIVNKKASEGVRLSCAMASETLAAVARLDDEAFERWCIGIKKQLGKLKADEDKLWDVLLKAMDERIARGKKFTAKIKLVATAKATMKPRQPREPPPNKFLRGVRRGIIGAPKPK